MRAFRFCSFKHFPFIPKNVSKIEKETFSGGHIESIDSRYLIPGNIKTIDTAAFSDNCINCDISMEEGVESIGDDAFRSCWGYAKIVSIPSSVKKIGSHAFYDCQGLESITVRANIPPAGGEGMFDETNDCPIYVPLGSVASYKSAPFWSEYADRIQANPDSIPKSIDLGLSVKWASFNLGASSPEEYGDYYAWGETEPYYISQDPLVWKEGKESGYAWSSYKWCMGDWNMMTKYCNDSYYGYNGFSDTKTVLDLEDDAANVNLGSKWRMPTDAEWTELREKCTWTWTLQNGVNGWLVTASNGNSIFLPSADYRRDIYFGTDGGYWSSSLDTSYPSFAWSVSFVFNSVLRDYNLRCLGFSVRPVYAE